MCSHGYLSNLLQSAQGKDRTLPPQANRNAGGVVPQSELVLVAVLWLILGLYMLSVCRRGLSGPSSEVRVRWNCGLCGLLDICRKCF